MYMAIKEISLFGILLLFLLGSCKDHPTPQEKPLPQNKVKKDSIIPEEPAITKEVEEKETFELNEDNAIEGNAFVN